MSTVAAHTFHQNRHPHHAGPVVLVAEDFEETRFMLRVMLELDGYRVVEAGDGLQAVDAVQRERPDLVLMDLHLPRLDGFAATRRIRETRELRDLPIVALTSNGTSEYRSRAVAAGCDEFLTKPINFVRLGEILSHFLLAENRAAS